ncbi:glycoside hydrolase family 5 protein [Candidatus Saccharibacteria bacterium]|nr:glycoside hydrolase family 5 protein [Candidatus Saccharibacteria bacterium]
MRGVNLGGWLVLERWITPAVFEGLSAQDETAFCLESGKDKAARLSEHRRTFITEDDFRWMASNNLNAVRIPLPHWLFGGVEPYIGGAEFLDKAMDWAGKYDLKVVLDIHTAPGSQNGQSHSGLAGGINWHKDKKNIAGSLEFLTKLCQHYGQHQNLYGIELLNEPKAWITPRILRKYYKDGYDIVRGHCGDNTAVVISDYFAPWRWHKFMPAPQFKNVIRDTHLYQCHRTADKKLSIKQHIQKADIEWKDLIDGMQTHTPVIVGEWSLALVPETFSGMSHAEKKAELKAYSEAQITTFDKTTGWFYWTYKTEEANLWNFRYSLESGLIVLN